MRDAQEQRMQDEERRSRDMLPGKVPKVNSVYLLVIRNRVFELLEGVDKRKRMRRLDEKPHPCCTRMGHPENLP